MTTQLFHPTARRLRLRALLPFAGAVLATAQALAQSALPGKPEENGLQPVGETVYINTPDTINNGKSESIGIAIARNGNVVVGWEDDGDALQDNEAVWTLFDRDGKSISPDTEMVSVDPSFAPQSVTSKFFSFFRGTGLTNAIPPRTSWGPKIKANPFGDGFGMGATAFDLGLEVPSLAAFVPDQGDFPAVQLLSNTGEPISIVTGVSQEYSARDGNIRIGDWDYLANGNIVVVGESRQGQDLVDVYGGESAQNHVIFRVVDATGKEVKAVQLASANPTKTEMWHGIGVTKNGFAIRFSDNGPGAIRLFDNTGTAVSTNIDLAVLTGQPIANGGGRGDGVGFHGNGVDAYAAVAFGAVDGKNTVWVTVLNADGTVRWSKSASDDIELAGPGRGDVGIDALGRVAVVYDDAAGTGGSSRIVLGRVFDPTGKPLGGTFYVSEKELPDAATQPAVNPRVAFRNDTVAVSWLSKNSGNADLNVVALRQFVVPVKPGTIEAVGLTRIVPDTVIINQDLPSLGNWEPFASVVGTSTFLVEGNAYAEDADNAQRFVVAIQPAAGGAMKLAEGFYGDDGAPYKGQINASRQNGNPGRVAGDRRPGAVNYVVGAEASPHVYDAFKKDNRWNLGFDRLDDGRYGTVQFYSLDTGTLTPTPKSKALDSANGRLTTGAAPGNQITRFGGDVVGLSDGNFASVVEDRSNVRNPSGNAAVATVFAPDGTVVKESVLVANGDLWCNVAAFKGGFAVRVAGKLYFFDNAGVQQGDPVDQATSGETFDGGRGDGTRMGGHINSPFVYLAGKVANSSVVRVAAWDGRTRAFVAVADASEGGFRGDADRTVVAADALDRIVVAWVSKPDGYEANQVAARVLQLDEATKSFKPLTASFLPFVNVATSGGISTFGMSVAMTTKQILVAAKGSINLQNKPNEGANSPTEINFYTVISHPAPKDDPTPAVGSGGGDTVTLAVSRAGNVLTITSTPQPLPAGFVLQVADSVNGPWLDQVGANTPVPVTIGANSPRFLRAVKK